MLQLATTNSQKINRNPKRRNLERDKVYRTVLFSDMSKIKLIINKLKIYYKYSCNIQPQKLRFLIKVYALEYSAFE
ncbi:hypothetical protein DSM106972_083650 [Dulcicalothrix desertica PCC 7102]|uniref:Uncharacterized protein n=1 Tax=Dulcicalothrix desertica PCC 7102 TaxID=232991 RepID=A0A433UUX3_9CYAN|nr:hypothetical protein DSM106972_083650 [Dulcicalothrix desertica PCC 7102]